MSNFRFTSRRVKKLQAVATAHGMTESIDELKSIVNELHESDEKPIWLKDYLGEPIERVVTLGDYDYDESFFNYMKVDTTIDQFLSRKGGIPPATISVITGDAGTGKTSVLLWILVKLHKRGKRVLFVSNEMTRIDLYEFIQFYPGLESIPMLFMNDHEDIKASELLANELDKGFDHVLIDSMTETQDLIQESEGCRTKTAMNKLLDIMIRNTERKNSLRLPTSFHVIQQVNKSGKFVGSNKLKHNTTSMMKLRMEGHRRYMEFSKNRRGDVGIRLYYTMSETDGIIFDIERYNMDKMTMKMLNQNREKVDSSSWSTLVKAQMEEMTDGHDEEE